MSKDSNKIIGKRFVCMSDFRTKECTEECACNCGSLNCKEAVMFDCTCECPKHPYPKLDINT